MIIASKIFSINSVSKKVYQTAEKKSLLIVLPFLGRLSFETRNRLSSCIKSQLPFCSLKIAYQSKNRFSNLFKFKESIPKYLRSHLIYKFMCSCCNATYYGETKRHLFVRASIFFVKKEKLSVMFIGERPSVVFIEILTAS